MQTLTLTGNVERDQGYAAGVMAPRVAFRGRFKKGLSAADWGCCAIFLVGVLAYLAMGFYIFSRKNFEITPDGVIASVELIQEQEQCGGFPVRRLETDVTLCDNTWCLFSAAAYIPVVTILLVPVIGLLWLVGLYFATAPIVWLSSVFNGVFLILIGVALLVELPEEPVVGGLFVGLGSFSLLFLAYTRESVRKAIGHFKFAIHALSKNKDVFLASGILQLLMIAFVGLHWFFTLSLSQVGEIDPISCDLIIMPKSVYVPFVVMNFLLLWVIAFLRSASLVTVSMTVASWAFDQDDRPSQVALRSMATSLTTSAGANSVGALITALVEELRRRSTGPLFWLTPDGCIAKCAFLILQSCIQALTRFATVSHAITGESFFESAKSMFEILKRNFVGGYVLSQVGIAVVRVGSQGFSICIGLLAWYMMDQEFGANSLVDVVDTFQGLFGFVAFMIAYLYLLKFPLFTILIISFIMPFLSELDPSVELLIAFGAVFVSSISALILNFTGSVVLDALDTMFVVYAVSNEAGRDGSYNPEMAQLYVLMQDVPEAKVVQTHSRVPESAKYAL